MAAKLLVTKKDASFVMNIHQRKRKEVLLRKPHALHVINNSIHSRDFTLFRFKREQELIQAVINVIPKIIVQNAINKEETLQ